MMFVDKPLKEFCDKFGITSSPEDETCPSCLQSFPPPRPFFIPGYAGIQYECACAGPYSKPATMVPRTEEKRAFWQDLFGADWRQS